MTKRIHESFGPPFRAESLCCNPLPITSPTVMYHCLLACIMHFRFVPDLIWATRLHVQESQRRCQLQASTWSSKCLVSPSYHQLWRCHAISKEGKTMQNMLNAAGKHDCLPQAATLSICNDFFTRGVIYLRQSGWGDFEACAMVSQLALVQLSFHGFRTSGEGNKLQILQNDRASWQSSSANSQATFKNSIPYIRQRA